MYIGKEIGVGNLGGVTEFPSKTPSNVLMIAAPVLINYGFIPPVIVALANHFVGKTVEKNDTGGWI